MHQFYPRWLYSSSLVPEFSSTLGLGTNSPESEEEPVPIPENGLPGWIAVGVQYNPSDLRKYFLCDGKTWDSGKLNIEHHCSHPVLKQNWKKWMRAANPSWNGKHTQVRKCFVFFCGLELHGIKIDWSTVNASKAINRYSMIEKEKARKELWRMQVKFDGELCEPVDPDSKKRRRTPSKPTPNKRPRETSGNTELPVGAEDEPTNLSSGEAPSNQQPTPDKGKAVVEDEPTRLDPNLAAKMEKARVKEATRRSLEDPLTVPGFAVNDHGESSGQRSKGNLDSSCPPRPTTEVEKTAEGVHGWIDEMLRNVMIANQERDQIQSRLKQAEEKLLKVEAVRNANDESDRIQERLKEAEEKIKALEQEKKEMSERALMMERPDLYELLESKLTGYQIRGHPYGIASFPDVNLTITKKWTTFPEDIEAFEGNMDAFPELKHAVEVHSGMTVYKTDCSVCGHALGFLPRIDSGVCEHKYHLNCFWNYASTSRRCPVCRVPYPRQMYEFFCTVFVPEGSKVINRDTGLQDVENSNPHPGELHAGRGGLVAVNEVDVAARNEDKIHLMNLLQLLDESFLRSFPAIWKIPLPKRKETFGDDRYWGDSFHRAIKAFWPEESTAASVPPKPVVPLNPESPPSRDASSPSQSFTSEVLIPLHGVITCKIKSSCTLDTSSPSVVVDSLTTAIHKRRKLPRWIQRLAEPVRMSGYVSSSGEDDEYTSSG
ncbi:hypothetical protein R1sor_021546 [Riccia sorocarpa]|uniref:RING-type domain-containing protein n=1 Tax=Riccia sorocarpa TaxID=122646 RepID=A0ABD3GKH5_9MARC